MARRWRVGAVIFAASFARFQVAHCSSMTLGVVTTVAGHRK
jgi:hypothetical protein